MNAKKTEQMLEQLDAILADEEDRVILKAASVERVQRVEGTRGQRAGANRSADSQAWTMGGNVD